jgi:alginate O-acetyltransferase complex protein AlgI
MLFNSFEFLFIYFPLVVTGFFLLGSRSPTAAAAWLLAASLFFYGWWNPVYVSLLLASIVFNFVCGKALARGEDIGSPRRRRLLIFSVVANLGLLAYYKYADFFIGTLNSVAGSELPLLHLILPLGISFFCFTQIAFLVDAARGHARELNFVHYGLFVTYFPHLIAGPVLHHGEMMPQFKQAQTYRFRFDCLAIGMSFFALGLFKKVVLADSVAEYVGDPFNAAASGDALQFFEAWSGALCYTLQLYFDFSGYCDMAIGLSFVFGIRLPVNFNSPYKARNIADFWRRWHMTLSRFLRDYLYIPLGGNRFGSLRRFTNLFTTMLLGGLWHGAGWTFVVWGALHGLYLIVHQGWEALCRRLGWASRRSTRTGRCAAVSLTFLAVVVGWVFFRSPTVAAAWALLEGMAGLNGVAVPSALASRLGLSDSSLQASGISVVSSSGRNFVMAWLWILVLLPVVFWAPNTQELFSRVNPTLQSGLRALRAPWAWMPSKRWAAGLALVFALGLLSLTRPSEFLYFQF